MSLKIRHLEVFNALFEAGSVSQAAQRLNLTQPAVSIALSNLEEELGFRLFHRNRGFFAPTGEAAQLRGEITLGLMALARVDRRADEIRQGWAGGRQYRNQRCHGDEPATDADRGISDRIPRHPC